MDERGGLEGDLFERSELFCLNFDESRHTGSTAPLQIAETLDTLRMGSNTHILAINAFQTNPFCETNIFQQLDRDKTRFTCLGDWRDGIIVVLPVKIKGNVLGVHAFGKSALLIGS